MKKKYYYIYTYNIHEFQKRSSSKNLKWLQLMKILIQVFYFINEIKLFNFKVNFFFLLFRI